MIKRILLANRQSIIFILGFFFDRSYLEGRYFEEGLQGIKWAVRAIWTRNILRLAPPRKWPIALGCHVSNCDHVNFHPDDLNNFQSPGTYYQSYKGKINIGRGCYIAPNVGLITANHDLENLDEHADAQDINLGERCWIGMNSVILPGVVLGANTTVAAGAVVSRSFPQGNVVIGGIPARIIRELGRRE